MLYSGGGRAIIAIFLVVVGATGYLYTPLGQVWCLGHGTRGKQSGRKHASPALSPHFTTVLYFQLKSWTVKSEGVGEITWSVPQPVGTG